MYEGYIYKITNSLNGHFYIGQTRTTVEKRFYHHTKDSCVQKYQKYGLYKAFKKYGVDNFYFETLETHCASTIDELNKILNSREIELIASGRLLYGNDFLYNHSAGGDYDGCPTEKIPIIQYDLCCNEINRYESVIEGKLATGAFGISSVINKKPEFLSAGGYIWRRQDNPLTDEEKRYLRIHFDTMPVKQYGYGGVLLAAYNSISDAALTIKFDIKNINQHIRNCCNHIVKTACGYIWRYEFDDIVNSDINNKKNHFAIEQRENGTGNLINTFISTCKAEELTGIDGAVISQCCNHKKDSAGGYLWNRVGDYNPEILKTIRIKPVVQLTSAGEYVATYNSPHDASDITKINRADIIGVCRGKLKTAGNYKWKYLYEYLNIFSNKEVNHA